MGEGLMFSDREMRFLRELTRLKVDFMIVGLSAAALQGAPVVTQDIDLWFRNLSDPRIKEALSKVGGIYVPSVGHNPPMFAGDAVKLFDIVVHMHGLGSFDKESAAAAKVSLGRFKVRVLSLEQIIRSKRALGREKDRMALRVLRDTCRSVAGRR